MSLFDANCFLGRRSIHTPLGQPTTPDALLAEMDRLGIAEALVTHAMAVDGHPRDGNERLLREIAGRPRLHPCWVLLPSSGELPPPQMLLQQMRERGVRAARLCPARHRYALNAATVGDLLAALEAARVPTLIDYEVTHWGEVKTDWEALDTLCTRYPRLPLIVVGESLCVPRRLFPFWDRHANLYLETSYYQPHQGLSQVARRFGARRLLFGTGLPVRAPGPPLAQLAFDFLSDAERAAIGGDTLRELLRECELPRAACRVPEFPLRTPHAALRTPDHPILDAHVHLGEWYSTAIHAGDAEGLVKSMDRLGIRQMALIAFDAIGPEMREGNDQVAAAMRRFPGRFLGYATVDPNEPEAMAGELERCFDRLGFHAIKFHCDTHGYPADGPNYRPALRFADERGLVILIHGRITEAMLEEFPNARFLSAHVGGWNGRGTHYAVELACRYPNLYLDLAASTVYNGVLEALVAAAGAERIVHGSDAPLMDPGYQLGRVLAAKLAPEEKRLILHDNAARLFGLAS